MKVDNRFHCFGCGADGDVIDFVMQLYGIGSMEAAQKLASDFGISYDNKSRASPRPVQESITGATAPAENKLLLLRIV